MPIDGLISGLNTSQIIDQLMSAERAPVDLMSMQRDKANAAIDAYKSVEAKMATVLSASSALDKASTWQLRTATVSDPNAATISASSGATLGTLSFSVDRLAATHGVVTSTVSGSATDVIAPGGSITMTIGATPHTISVGTGTLTEVANAVNGAGLDVRAAVVNTGAGYRLQLTAAKSGAAAAFTVDSGLNIATAVTSQGIDARIIVGDGAGAYQVTSSTNVFSDLFPGVTITAKTAGSGTVVADVSADSTGLANKIQTLVDAVNGALSEIKTRTAYDPSSKKAASLTGDSAVRRTQQALTRAVTDAVGQSSLGSPGGAGIGIDKNGNVTFDKAAFQTAYAANPAATERMFVQGATTTGSISFVSAGPQATAGARDVIITQAAAQAASVGMVGTMPVTTPATVRVMIGTTIAVFTLQPSDTDVSAAAGLQSALDAAGLPIKATAEGGGLKLTSTGYGTATKFDVAWDGTNYSTIAGIDAAGTIGGVTATGAGRQLSVPATNGTLGGLTISLTSDATGAVGTVNYEPGVAQRLTSAATAASNGSSGYLIDAQAGRQSKVDMLTKSMDAYNVRLTAREARLRREFAHLETTLNTLKSQSTALNASLGTVSSISTGTASSSSSGN